MSESHILWNGVPLLPPIGALVLIEHGRDDKDHVCVVTGYEVKPSLRGNDYRILIDLIYRGSDVKNQRMLSDIRPLMMARSIAQETCT
ncbi:hypothetical protein [Burkholderia anthina]|uniref:hypothetical protein n=1 Tax=Burkholderia anthina TaxID=179879 RepID=UPI00158A1CE5|nr:hypothetical protein [Burkholderia anthina]